MKKQYWKKLNVCVVVLLLCGLLTGCGSNVVFTTGFGKDQVFQIGEDGCNTPQIMVYLLSMKAQYEAAFGAGIWDANIGEGNSLEAEVKDSVLEKAAQIKTMYLMAKERELELSEKETSAVNQATQSYMNRSGKAVLETYGITEEIIRQMYFEYAMANKVYDEILAGITPEVSDDEARIITVQHILFKTYDKDADGRRVYYTQDHKAEVKEKAVEVWQLATDGTHDFTELAARYSADPTVQYSFAKGEMDARFETAASNLAAGEISDVVESESGYHIIKCIETLNREKTDANKLDIMERRRNEVFGTEYDAFVETLARRVNTTLWEDVSFVGEGAKNAPNFFEIYEILFTGL